MSRRHMNNSKSKNTNLTLMYKKHRRFNTNRLLTLLSLKDSILLLSTQYKQVSSNERQS